MKKNLITKELLKIAKSILSVDHDAEADDIRQDYNRKIQEINDMFKFKTVDVVFQNDPTQEVKVKIYLHIDKYVNKNQLSLVRQSANELYEATKKVEKVFRDAEKAKEEYKDKMIELFKRIKK